MSIERYDRVSQHAYLPSLSTQKLQDLSLFYNNSISIPFKENPNTDYILDDKLKSPNKIERIDFKARSECINTLKSKVDSKNSKEISYYLIKSAISIALIALGVLFLSFCRTNTGELGAVLAGIGGGIYMMSSIESLILHNTDKKGAFFERVFSFLGGPLFQLYSANKFNDSHNEKSVEKMAIEFIEDFDTARASLSKSMDHRKLDKQWDNLKKKGLLDKDARDKINQGRLTLLEIHKLHAL